MAVGQFHWNKDEIIAHFSWFYEACYNITSICPSQMLWTHIIDLGIKHLKVDLHIIWDPVVNFFWASQVSEIFNFLYSIFFVKHWQFCFKNFTYFSTNSVLQKKKHLKGLFFVTHQWLRFSRKILVLYTRYLDVYLVFMLILTCS